MLDAIKDMDQENKRQTVNVNSSLKKDPKLRIPRSPEWEMTRAKLRKGHIDEVLKKLSDCYNGSSRALISDIKTEFDPITIQMITYARNNGERKIFGENYLTDPDEEISPNVARTFLRSSLKYHIQAVNMIQYQPRRDQLLEIIAGKINEKMIELGFQETTDPDQELIIVANYDPNLREG